MPEQKLKALLQSLREELANTPELDANSEKLLSGISADIEKRLEKNHTDENNSISESVNRALEQFEESHPTLHGLLIKVSETLSQMGI
jgi:hypothetical protein